MLVSDRRLAVLEKFGGKCVRCGFSDPRALQIDHIYGKGSYPRMYSNSLPWDMLLNPEKFQLLCANCNWIKRYENNEIRLAYPREPKMLVTHASETRTKILGLIQTAAIPLSQLVDLVMDKGAKRTTVYGHIYALRNAGVVTLTPLPGRYNRKLVSIVPAM